MAAAASTGATGDATSDGGDGDGGGSDDGWQDGRHKRREGDKGSAADLAGGCRGGDSSKKRGKHVPSISSTGVNPKTPNMILVLKSLF